MKKAASMQNLNQNASLINKLDEQFIKIMLEIEKHYVTYNKHEKIRIEQWSKKLCQVTINNLWKQNRNLYALLLLDAIMKGNLQEPFNKIPPEGSLPTLNKHIVKTRIGTLEEKIENGFTELPQNDHTPKKKTNQKSRSNSIHNTPPNPESKPKSREKLVSKSQNLASRGSSVRMNDRLALNEINHEIENRNLENQYSSRSNDYNSLKYIPHQSPESVKSNGLRRSEAKEVLKFRAELDLSKLTNESLKNEINMKNITIQQLTKKLDHSHNEIKVLEEQKDSLLKLFSMIKKKVDEGSVTIEPKESAVQIMKEFNELCPKFFISPLKNSLTSEYNVNPFQTYNSNLINKNTSMMLSQSNTMQTQSAKPNNDDNSIDEMENYLHKIASSNSKAFNDTFNKSPSFTMKYEEVKRKMTAQDKDTMDFLTYLDNFQKDTENLKKQSEQILIRSAQLSKNY